MTSPHMPAPLVVASNRGPVELRTDAAGQLVEHRGAGGLIGVLGPALAGRSGTWVAAALTDEDRAAARRPRPVELPEGAVRLRLLDLDPRDYNHYYRSVSTELLWFLQHHLLDPAGAPVAAADLRTSWRGYRRVNAEFATVCAEELAPSGIVLVQDYHLSLVPGLLREMRPDARIAHFTMIPWADRSHFRMVPDDVAAELLDGLLAADMLGFLVPRWADAFVETCGAAGHAVAADGRTVRADDGREVAIRCFPVGVDADQLRRVAEGARVATHIRDLRRQVAGHRLVVRIDRMEPTKNILRGLAGFAELLERDRNLRGRVVHYVLAYSSRQELPAYRDYDRGVRRMAARINDRYGTPTWQPVILETHNDFQRGIAALALADVLVVNTLRDGMNLVAKEGPVVSRHDLALVLSTEAGAADELAAAATMVDPFDVTALADGIAAGLDMPRAERASRLALLRKAAGALPPRQWLVNVLDELHELLRAPG